MVVRNSMEYSVREFRLRHGLSQQEVADLLGVHIRSVQKYEDGMGIRDVKRRILEDYDKEHAANESMDAKERMCLVLDYTGLNANLLSQKIGLPKYRLYDITQGRTKAISYEIADKVTSSFTTISRDWLLTGKGSMLVGDGVSTPDPEQSPAPLTPKTAVRYYPNIPITASHIEDMPNPSYEDTECQLLTIPGFEGCVAFPAVGDSMYPRISNGDIVVFREWQESYISNGEIYLIITRLGDRTIKYLTQITDDDGGKHYLCRSANPDQDKYAPFEIDGDDIVRLYSVHGCIKKFRM